MSSEEGSVPDAKHPHILLPTEPDPTTTTSNTPTRSLRKRKRTNSYHGEGSGRLGEGDSDGSDARPSRKTKRAIEVPMINIRPPPLAFPKSLYHGHVPPMPQYPERALLRDVLAEENNQEHDSQASDGDHFIDADLEDFAIYREHKSYRGNRQKRVGEAPLANELVSLHEINEWNVPRFYFDGIIWHGGKSKYVQRVPFDLLSIGGYREMDSPAVESDIWIQSVEGKRHNVWYRLRTPAAEYRKYYEPFLWMAELAKHVVDFISTHQSVLLYDFRAKFREWLNSIYGPDELISLWVKQHGNDDFRHVVASQANFLWCQASQVDEDLENHPVWSEIHPRFLSAIPEQRERETRAEMFASSEQDGRIIARRKTTVTPYVHECFKHMPWAKFLYYQVPSIGHTKRDKKFWSTARHYDRSNLRTPELRITSCSRSHERDTAVKISVGDVVALPPDKMTTWKSNDSDWYGFVQSVTDTDKGRELGILWLYRPSDTQCLRVPYPFSRELFLSDHCNCGDTPIYAQEVIGRPRVAIFGGPTTQGVKFFVRQRYIEANGAWETLKDSDFKCNCKRTQARARYSIGDTILVSIKKILEPVALVKHEPDGLIGKLKVRRLLRRHRDYHDAGAEPNELVLTNQFQIIAHTDVFRACHIRFYTEEDKAQKKIPPPYNRGGSGDCYFISAQDLQSDGSHLEALPRPWPALVTEGWDPSRAPPQRPMKGLDIFCGGGNLGRGLEEGRAVKFDWAVDLYSQAIHTYKANLEPRNDTQLFRGDVNDYLTQAMQGRGGNAVAQSGQVEVIAAGSPCQGFSNANPNKENDRSLFNISMVASVVAFIDFYRPKYAFMENVKGMTSGTDTENVLALIISALLGMGYQVRTFVLDAWSFGSPQSRSRVFISIAAPGMTPLPEPPHTHSHPEEVRSASLGQTANGLPTSSRYTMRTPFKYVTPAEATKDLPKTDARTTCISFPDHRMSRTLSTLSRVQVSSIPRFPAGASFITAYKKGYMPQAQIDAFSWHNEMRARESSTGWQRVRRNKLMATVMTEPRPDDGAGGMCLHWDEERLLTVMEVRRAQGFLDSDVLIGLPREQWKIIGNSVARPVALALGVALREAWLASTTIRKNGTNNAEEELSTNAVNEWGSHETRPESAVNEEKAASSPFPAQVGLDELKTSQSSPKVVVSTLSDGTWELLAKRNVEKSAQFPLPL